MRFDVFTLLPQVMLPYLQASMLGRAQTAGLLEIHLHNLRDYTEDRHRTTDDVPYGGGGGMVMKPEPIFRAVESVLGTERGHVPVVLLTPQGRRFDHATAQAFAGFKRMALICGRYEGVDERVRQYLAHDEISVGDYVLTGGELPALLVIDSVTRLLPGALGDADGAEDDSHASGLLEYPHYTRPSDFRGWRVPEVLMSGDHARIAAWRREQALQRTWMRRPDMIDEDHLSESERKMLRQWKQEAAQATSADGQAADPVIRK
jgi:tRNA (guanine37-N1)-methyltransferase